MGQCAFTHLNTIFKRESKTSNIGKKMEHNGVWCFSICEKILKETLNPTISVRKLDQRTARHYFE